MPRKTKYSEETSQVSMRLPQSLLTRIDNQAQAVNAPRAEVIVTALKKGLPKDRPAADQEDVFG